jgi:hypothetical protein
MSVGFSLIGDPAIGVSPFMETSETSEGFRVAKYNMSLTPPLASINIQLCVYVYRLNMIK